MLAHKYMYTYKHRCHSLATTLANTEAAPAPAHGWSLLDLNHAIKSIFYSCNTLSLYAFAM